MLAAHLHELEEKLHRISTEQERNFMMHMQHVLLHKQGAIEEAAIVAETLRSTSASLQVCVCVCV